MRLSVQRGGVTLPKLALPDRRSGVLLSARSLVSALRRPDRLAQTWGGDPECAAPEGLAGLSGGWLPDPADRRGKGIRWQRIEWGGY